MMQGVTDTFFFQYITKPFSDWFLQMGLQAASWSTAAIIITLGDETLDVDLPKVNAPTYSICTGSRGKPKNKKFTASPVSI
ncbi:non-heme chloroperoxidase [Salinibacillus kushneri]|uniref:Non-heme chloroperoxidase n=1 Tax=Salinibacillus kushneri TaxID=237682 RepID=A0A1I0AC68_9BACI|nr:non-heme chloroperoxidase [Salinibacillus kushneri]